MVRSDGENVTELLIRCRAHDDAAFSELVELYTPMINRTVSSFFDAPFDVSEAYSEACVVLHRAANSYDLGQTEVTFGLYARICIRNRMLDMLRTKRADVTISDIDVDELAVGGDIAARLIASESVDNYRRIAKELLSAYEYKIFLCVLKGFKTAEIAQLLETTPKSVDNAKSRMWKSLRDHFGRTE